MKVLRARLYDHKRQALDAERAADRKTQVGVVTGLKEFDVQFPARARYGPSHQLTLHKLDRILAGDELDEVVDILIAEDQAARLAEVHDRTTFSEYLTWGADVLRSAKVDDPRREARLLLSHASGQPVEWIIAHPEADYTAGRKYRSFIERVGDANQFRIS